MLDHAPTPPPTRRNGVAMDQPQSSLCMVCYDGDVVFLAHPSKRHDVAGTQIAGRQRLAELRD